MTELSSEDKKRYTEIRDNYIRTKNAVSKSLKSASSVKVYEAAIYAIDTNLKVSEAFKINSDSYAQTKGLLTTLSLLDKQIKGNIESILENLRPIIPDAERICVSCDMKSVFYEGRTPQGGASGGDEIYKCALCGRDNQSDNFRYDTKSKF